MYANDYGNTAMLYNPGQNISNDNNGGVKGNNSSKANISYTIAAYLRLSDQDDAKDESNSITNQRAMVRNYIASQSEFSHAEIVEYIDDGISGTHTKRNGYQQLMDDIERGRVHCIIVKDLSRIGRNLLDVDDLLMNHLVVHDIRFIALGERHDSLKHPMSNLELAFINLSNQHYARDLAQKSMSSRVIKMKRGEYLSCWALFGYKKSETQRNKIIIDEECADYVRLMFSLAAEGKRPPKIAAILNAQGIPTPADYKKQNGVEGSWSHFRIDPDYSFWCGTKVWRHLKDIRYTGTAVNKSTKVKKSGQKACLKRSEDEWVKLPKAHEAIITQAEFDKAHEALRRNKWSDPDIGHIFYNKIKCAVCRRTLTRTNPKRPYFKCKTKYYTDHYDCPECIITQESLEMLVLESIKVHAAVMIDHEKLKLAAIQQSALSKVELERKISSERKAVQLLEESITKNITALISEKITQETFLKKKEIIAGTIAEKTAVIEKLCEQLKIVTEGKDAIEEKLAGLNPLVDIEKLDRELVDLLVEKVLVHGEKSIEIIWVGTSAAVERRFAKWV